MNYMVEIYGYYLNNKVMFIINNTLLVIQLIIQLVIKNLVSDPMIILGNIQ